MPSSGSQLLLHVYGMLLFWEIGFDLKTAYTLR